MIVFGVFLASIFVQLMYHLFLFSRLAFYKKEEDSQNKYFEKSIPVSIVVCCKNEIANINKLVSILIKQEYADFEIIFIDDFSTDGTYEALSDIKNEQIRLFQYKKKLEGKKELLQFGISQAKYDWILVCDADCIPSSSQWIKKMTSEIKNQEIEIVLGYAPFYDTNSFINAFSRYENFMTGIFYLSMALSKRAYMGVGRNMLFSKSLYLSVIEKVLNINTISGDDDLFINNASNRINTRICVETDSFVFSASKENIYDFIIQKKRHISTGYHYSIDEVIVLSAYPLSLILLCISLVCILFCFKTLILISCMLLFAYLTSSMLIKTYCAEKLNFKSKYPVLFLDILFLCYQILLHPLYLIKKNKQW
jgi:biofilm PGA synthesis N-glycosyltransferase PgaC